MRAQNLLALHQEEAERREMGAGEIRQSMFSRTGFRLAELGRQLDHVQSMLYRSANQALGDFTNFSSIADPSSLNFSEIFSIALTLIPGGSIAARLGGGTLGGVFEKLVRRASRVAVSRGVATATTLSSRGSEVAQAQLISREGEEHLRAAQGRHEDITEYMGTFRIRIDASDADPDEMRAIHAEIDGEIDSLRGIDDDEYVSASRQTELSLYRAYYVPSDGPARVRIEYRRTPIGIPSRPRVGGLPQAVRDRIIELTGQSALEILREWGAPSVTVGARYGEGYREVGQAIQQE
jgi:hypothetical protein